VGEIRLTNIEASIGFLANTAEQARELFWPVYQRLFTQPQCGPHGALMVGDAATVAEKLRRQGESFGGLDRVTLHVDLAGLDSIRIARAIELLGTQVAERLRAPSPQDPRE
jgi:hypothetical protein